MKRLLWLFIAVLTCVSAGCIVVSSYLAFGTLRSAQQEAYSARFALAAQRAVSAAEQALALGVPLSAQPSLEALLARESALDPAIVGFAITSADGQPLLGQGLSKEVARATTLLQRPIQNDLGHTVAQVQVHYDASALAQAQQRLRQQVVAAAWPALVGVCVATLLFGMVLSRQLTRPRRRAGPVRALIPGGLRALLTATSALLLCLGMVSMGWGAHRAGQALIQPDQLAKAGSIARSSAGLIERALAVDIPAEALAGMDTHIDAVRRNNPEVAALVFVASDGRTLHGSVPAAATNETFPSAQAPVLHRGESVGQVVVMLDPGVLARRLQTTLLDMAFLGAVTLLMSLELLALALGSRGARALAATEVRQQRLTDPAHRHAPWRSTSASAVRPALFLFMLTEELTRPFLPAWARQLAPQAWGLSPELLASFPLVLFLATVALLQWPLATWSERHGRRTGFLWGALLSAVGLALAAWLPSYGGFLAARMLSAVGFALVFVSGQGVVIDGSGAADRARSLAQFVRAILVAGLCGPPLGGLIADRWGVAATFAVCSGLALLAAGVAWLQIPPDRHSPLPQTVQPDSPTDSIWRTVQTQPGLVALLLGCALPAKLLLAALCFYLLPVYLQDMGHGSAVIGRLQTIYPLTMVLLVPVAARLADRWSRRGAFVVVGGFMAGASAMLAWSAGASPAALALVLLGLGLGQSLSIAPQSALIADFSRRVSPRQGAGILGLFRMVERGGSALGPATGAVLLATVGFGPALATIGMCVLGGSLVCGWKLHRGGVA
ncbi:MAG: MFS transporter [Burkholderiaceae bacterium]|nr:MFS transporter [Burkholderiaceae bacterium]